jgi:hypothetical protein
LKKGLDSFRELRDFASKDYVQAKTLEASFATINKLSSSLGNMNRIRSREAREDLRRKVIKKKIEEAKQGIASIRNRDEVSELSKVHGEIEELKKELDRHFRHLQKPFLKFQKSVQSPRISLPLDETRKLSQYIDHPFEALAAEQNGYPQLRRILQGLADALSKGKLTLKRSRLEKAQGQINSILKNGAMTTLYERCRKAFSLRQRLSKSEAVAISEERRTLLEENLNELKKRKKIADSRLDVLERRRKTGQENIESQKEELENAILELTGKILRIAL